MKNKQSRKLKFSKTAIAIISLNQINALKGGTLPTSAPNSTGLHSQCEEEMCR